MCNILKESRWTQDRNTAVVNDWEYKHILLMLVIIHTLFYCEKKCILKSLRVVEVIIMLPTVAL